MRRLALTLAVAALLAAPVASAAKLGAGAAARASNALGTKLLRAEGAGNTALSPWSVWSALTMAYAGADGKTRTQMARVLHVRDLRRRTGSASAALQRALGRAAHKSDAKLDAASALWGATDASFRRRFLALLRRDYGAPLQRVDFRGDPDGARNAINAWVADHTGGRITDLFAAPDITRTTRLVLANALYFKATWLDQFDPNDTRPAPFHAPGGDVEVPTMRQRAGLGYTRGAGFQAVRLPYKGDRLSMLVVLPDPGRMAAVERKLGPSRIAKALEPTDLELSMPRFKVATRLALSDRLAALGMPLAFGDDAGFSGISAVESLKIHAVVHQAWIQVGEEGTEAAAATGISFEPTSGSVQPPKRLAIDRPFLFALRDDRTGAVLFLGRVDNPS